MSGKNNKSLIFVSFLLLSVFIASIRSHGHSHGHHHHQHSSCLSPKPEASLQSILLVGLVSSLVFGFVGILPSFFIHADTDEQKFVNSRGFKCLLAFAAGSLLGDVFLHLIPEATYNRTENEIKQNGLISILAFFLFLLIEKVTEMVPNAHALGTLNLIANVLDNTAHGTSVIGAFQNSFKFGLVALIATVIHEVPHEFSDFALLLRDGYRRRTAVIAQLFTAFAGTLSATLVYAVSSSSSLSSQAIHGSSASHCSSSSSSNMYSSESQQQQHDGSLHDHSDSQRSMILPFTIGGFLYIALVGIIPDILAEQWLSVSLRQLFYFIVGVMFIFALSEVEMFIPYLLI